MKVRRASTAVITGLLGLATACTSQTTESGSPSSAAPAVTQPSTATGADPVPSSAGVVSTDAVPPTGASTPDTVASVDSAATVAADSTVPASTVPGLAAGNTAAGSTTGISDDAINVAYIGVDFSALAGTGLVPELGDQEKQVQSFVDEINANGGIAGRQINLDFTLIDVLGGGIDVIQAECIAATQEFEAAVVVLPPAAARDLARCTAVTNQTLTLHATAFDDALYSEAQGRLFATGGVSVDRQFRAWADKMNELGYLDNTTIGVVVGDRPAEFSNAVNDALVPALEALGHSPAEVITLPCASATSCEQYDVAATKLQEAGVDTVFLQLANTFGPGLVQAAADIDYHPQWLIEGNQVTNTVLQFFASVKDSLDGAIGVGFSFNLPDDINQGATDCNQVVADRSGDSYEPGSDAFGFASTVCGAFRMLQRAGDGLAGGPLDQGSLIAAIEAIGTVEFGIGPDGSLSPSKHDAGDYLFLCDYQAAVGQCVRRSDPPFKVPA